MLFRSPYTLTTTRAQLGTSAARHASGTVYMPGGSASGGTYALKITSTGNVDGMMTKIADFYDVECEATVAALTSLIEPMLIVFLGVVVGGIVMAMFLPIFQLGAVAGGVN